MSGPLGMAKAAVSAVGSVVGIRTGTAEPAYTVQQRIPHSEIRRYGERVVAETLVEGDEEAVRNAGFRRLAGYIFGGNHSRTKFAMTAPVAQQAAGERIAMTSPVAQQASGPGQWAIRFFMPAGVSVESLPEPDDSAVRLTVVPAETIAVHTFTGDRGRDAVQAHTAVLLDALNGTVFEPSGAPQAWFYDPPWTIPLFRRNEIVVAVNRR